MAKERGAWVVGIVNRRNSDLVYKSPASFIRRARTSDVGREHESLLRQNAAGRVWQLALAPRAGRRSSSRDADRRRRSPSSALPPPWRTLGLDAEIEQLRPRFAL
jgi:hypothetical protein